MISKIPSVTMSNGVKLPLFGLGTWQATDEAETKKALEHALSAGYRYFDTAQVYGNEHILGEFFDEKFKDGTLSREEIFITSKLAPTNHSPEKAEESIQKSLVALKTDYIDLFLIHLPYPMETIVFTENGPDPHKSLPDYVPLIDTWRVLEKYYTMGKFRAIGISNFNDDQIKELYDQADIIPHNHQIECHIFRPQHEVVDLCKSLGITVTSYGTIGSLGRGIYKKSDDPSPMKAPLVIRLGKKYGKTPAQILLRQMLQRNISVIPKSTNPTRLQENIDIFDFELIPDEMQEFDKIAIRVKLYSKFWDGIASQHPWYPYGGV